MFSKLQLGLTWEVVRKSKFLGDGFSTIHSLSAIYQEPFNQHYSDSFSGLPENLVNLKAQLQYRAFTYYQAFTMVENLSGCNVEIGVNYGIYAKTIERRLIEQEDSLMYLIDVWGGQDSRPGYEPDIYDLVSSRFANKQYKILRGLAPAVIDKIPSHLQFKFVAIDLNHPDSEVESLKLLLPRVVQGGVIFIDDYGWGFGSLDESINALAIEFGLTIFPFASGNAILVKK